MTHDRDSEAREDGNSGSAVKSRLAISFFAIMIILASILQTGIDSERNYIGLSHGNLKSSTSTVLELLGGLRTVTAAFLWIKVDRIHDNYYGNLQTEAELIPMYRMVTWLNPHIDEAYYIGSYMLYKFDKPTEAWKFNQEGIKMNPMSGKLELNAGHFILSKHGYNESTTGDYKRAAVHFERAISLGNMDDNEFLIVYHNLRFTYEQLGMEKEAEETGKALERFRLEIQKNEPSVGMH